MWAQEQNVLFFRIPHLSEGHWCYWQQTVSPSLQHQPTAIFCKKLGLSMINFQMVSRKRVNFWITASKWAVKIKRKKEFFTNALLKRKEYPVFWMSMMSPVTRVGFDIDDIYFQSICRLPESGQESTAVFHPLDDPEPSLDINFEVLKFLPTNRPHPKVGRLYIHWSLYICIFMRF